MLLRERDIAGLRTAAVAKATPRLSESQPRPQRHMALKVSSSTSGGDFTPYEQRLTKISPATDSTSVQRPLSNPRSPPVLADTTINPPTTASSITGRASPAQPLTRPTSGLGGGGGGISSQSSRNSSLTRSQSEGQETWRRAAEVTQNLKARIEMMKVCRFRLSLIHI